MVKVKENPCRKIIIIRNEKTLKIEWRMAILQEKNYNKSNYHSQGIFKLTTISFCTHNFGLNFWIATASAIRRRVVVFLWVITWNDLSVSTLCPVSNKCFAMELEYFLCIFIRIFSEDVLVYPVWQASFCSSMYMLPHVQVNFYM